MLFCAMTKTYSADQNQNRSQSEIMLKILEDTSEALEGKENWQKQVSAAMEMLVDIVGLDLKTSICSDS